MTRLEFLSGRSNNSPRRGEAAQPEFRFHGRILNGAKPAGMPMVQSTKFELVVNAQTAKMLNLAVSSSLLARADEVIEQCDALATLNGHPGALFLSWVQAATMPKSFLSWGRP